MSTNYCWYCFGNKGSARACPFCGALEGGRNKENQLQSGMELKDRYVIGGAADGGSNGVSYLAVDTGDGGRLVRIKEFMPKDYARRSDLNYDIITAELDNAAFERRKRLIYAQAQELIAAGRYSDVFVQNNTVYICSPLKKQLQKCQPQEEQNIGIPVAPPSSPNPEQYNEQYRTVPETPPYIPPVEPVTAPEPVTVGAYQQPAQGPFAMPQSDFAAPHSDSQYTAPDSSFDVSSGGADSLFDTNSEAVPSGEYSYSRPHLSYENEPERSKTVQYKPDSFIDNLKNGFNTAFNKVAALPLTDKALTASDKLLKKDNFDEDAASRNRRKRTLVGIFAIAALLLIVLLIILISSCGGGQA